MQRSSPVKEIAGRVKTGATKKRDETAKEEGTYL